MSLSTSNYKGARDVYPEDMRLRQYIFGVWERAAEQFGYEKYDAPILEPIEIYAAKSGEEIVNDQTYTFTDRGGRKVTIRPEMTPSVARMVAAQRQEMALPARLYSIANFMRYERPQKGREREFWQLNVDLFGAENVAADAEIITIADKILRAFGADENMFTIRINDRRLTNFIMCEYLNLTEDQANQMIKLFDRREKISQEDFNSSAYEIAFSNDPYVPCCESEWEIRIDALLSAKTIDDLPKQIRKNPVIESLKNLFEILEKCGIKSAKFDPTLMRGFDYYTGIVFEVFDNNPENNRAMFGGGRYDGLVGLFGVEDLPVVGFAPGETTTIEFLRAWNLLPELRPATDLVLLPLGEVDVSAVADELRASGVNVAIDFTDRKLDKKIRAAVKMGVQYLLFVGEEELTEQKYTLKNVTTGEENKLMLNNIIDVVTK